MNKGIMQWTSLSQIGVVIFCLVAIFSSAYIADHILKQRYQYVLENALSTVLSTTSEAIHIWEQEQYQTVHSLAENERIRQATRSLLQLPPRLEELKAAPAQAELRSIMAQYLHHFQGYFIISKEHVNLASSRNANIAKKNLLLKFPNMLAKVWRGETQVTPLQVSDVPLSVETSERPQKSDVTLFIVTPVWDGGEVIALFSLRIDPYTTLFPIIEKGRMAASGETYAFDRDGVMLSHSRFEKQLQRIGLIQQGEISALNIRLRDPGVNLARGEAVDIQSLSERPLTRMVRSVVSGGSGGDMAGYRDYRGVPVVGVWMWDESLDIGLATEQDLDEAYSLYLFMRTIIFGGALVAAGILLAVVWAFVTGKKEVLEVQRRLQAIVETANDGIVVINKKGIIQSVNPAMEEMFGYPLETMVGRNVSMLMPEPYHSQHDGYLDNYLTTGVEKIIGLGREVRGKRRDGSTFPIDLSVNRLEVASGLHFAGVIRDISERHRVQTDMEQAKTEAIEANKAKSTFLATMSHEIRTPLNGIVGTVDVLAHTQLDETQHDLVVTAQDSALLLQGIIDDILDFSKIEAGRLELEYSVVSMERIVEGLADSLLFLAKKYETRLLTFVDPELPLLQGDAIRLRQILYNLSGNAIKFSGGMDDRVGQVVVSVTQDKMEHGTAAVCIEVSDNGIGMSKEVVSGLFKPFVQGEADISRRFGGTGLGLVITDRLVQMMAGTIAVESSPNVGSTFRVRLPLQVAEEVKEEVEPQLNGVTVLLLECDKPIWILESYLGHAGAEVKRIAADDVEMQLERLDLGAQPPVVIVDASADEGMLQRVRDRLTDSAMQGKVRYIAMEYKFHRYTPATPEETLLLDFNCLHRSKLLHATSALVSCTPPRQDSALAAGINPDVAARSSGKAWSGVTVLLVDDNETNRKVIGRQLRMLGCEVVLAEDGEEALKIWRDCACDMVLTDCHMPVMNGYELAHAIRNEEADGRVPIVAITADALKGTAQKCYAAGMDDYLTKPVQLKQLEQSVERWLGSAADETQTEHADGQETNSDDHYVAAVDESVLPALIGSEDHSLLNDFYLGFISSSDPTMAQLQQAGDALDYEEVARQAHKLKSSSRTVGASRMGDCCERLELCAKQGDSQQLTAELSQLRTLYDEVCAWIRDYGGK